MKPLVLSGCVLGSALAACCGVAEVSPLAHGVDVPLPAESATVEALVPARATLAGLLVANRLSAELAAEVVDSVRDVFNPKNLQTGHLYRLTHALDGSFRAFEYDIDPDRLLSVSMRAPDKSGEPVVDVGVITTAHTLRRGVVEADITRDHPSLVGSLDAQGENIELALRLADILGGEVDFNSELQPGDHISALFDRIVHKDRPGEYGDIDAAVYEHGGHRIVGIRFDTPAGKPAWYDEHGRSLKRRFLKSPLPFQPRITSGFSASRVHPIYGDRRPHMGVDYAAPAGTTVVAVAPGVVVSADWAGEAGRMVVLRHSGGFETLYLHLSAFAPGLHAGEHLDQGAFIGRVGATGAATGPHLDYRIKKNGVYVDPVAELARMPPGDPIAADELPAFGAVRDRILQELTTRLANRTSSAAGPDTRPTPGAPGDSPKGRS